MPVLPHKRDKNGRRNQDQQDDDGDYQQHFKLAFLEGEDGIGCRFRLGEKVLFSGATACPCAFWAE